jgi:hypothetical protein
MVNRWTPKRCSLSWHWLGFIALAVAVFIWGLGYKLSLYDPPQAKSHQIPQAKLLSKNEQAIAVQSPLLKNAKDPSTPVPRVLPGITLLLAVAFRLLRLPFFRLCGLKTAVVRVRRDFAALTSFFFRPPPSLA